MIDYLKTNPSTIEYFVALLKRLKEEISEKRPHLKKKKALFYEIYETVGWPHRLFPVPKPQGTSLEILTVAS